MYKRGLCIDMTLFKLIQYGGWILAAIFFCIAVGLLLYSNYYKEQD